MILPVSLMDLSGKMIVYSLSTQLFLPWTVTASSSFHRKKVSHPLLILVYRYAHLILDLDPSLKPSPSKGVWDFSVLHKSNDTVGDGVNEPRKRQHLDTSYVSPEPSQPAKPPYPPKQDIVKTPRPDITAGLRHSTIVEALIAQGLKEIDASEFLEKLQQQQILCSDPTNKGTLRFPPMVVEGKSYSTGKNIFEAQNQAAVSGSIMTNLQLQLANLAGRASSGSYVGKLPLAFSICTEGPYMELWVHYTTLCDDVRMYNMDIIKTCHASLQEGVVEFLMELERVMDWASIEFLNEIMEQLVLVERAVRA